MNNEWPNDDEEDEDEIPFERIPICTLTQLT